MALTFIAESAASAIIENLVSTCSSYLEACPAACGMQDELERLQHTLPQVQAVLTAVEGGAPVMVQNKALETWLWQLRDAVENAEDVLDELEYYELQKTIQDRDDKQEHFQALESLVIRHCKKIEYVPSELFGKFKAMKTLHIENCPKLTKRRISDIELPSVLGHLTIWSFGDLEVPLLWSADLTSLIWLELLDCASIASLPPAQVCARWTMLSRLDIKNCKELSSFGGIQALVSLRSLDIEGCDKLIEVALLLQPPFPNDVGQKKNTVLDCFLKNGLLSIDHHALLLMEPLRSLSSVCSLTLSDASRLASLPEEWLLQNHAALEQLCIRNARSLQSLPRSMTKLCSLVILGVEDANLIQSLPDLPTSLRCLVINSCHPVLKERCQENIGLDWPKIANIRYVRIT
ncbi:disease resistance protein RGA2-like [Ananas comosus]|uniref:Disease resistance protein RGA2-like n=1 Tax=Ananas comosus TaxID=4615 RepID=A0A6P5FRT2_ANACO|nr:disease resistance protein RGA2-like [Ananas comosus]